MSVAVAGARRTNKPNRASRHRRDRRWSHAAFAQRWSAVASAELGRSIRNRITFANAAGAIILGLAAVLHVWAGIEVDRLGYSISRARVVRQQLVRDLEQLRVAYEAETTPAALEKEAHERLGMSPPAPGHLVVLR
jgi:cell division protein FtsL